MIDLQDIIGLLPELWLAVVAMLLLLAGVFGWVRSLGAVSIAASLSLVVAVLLSFQTGSSSLLFDGAFSIDNYATFGRVLIFSGAAIAMLLSLQYFQREGLTQFEYPLLVLLASAGMGLMVTANDLITMYMAIELQSLALYVMAGFNRNSRRSTEAGLKYFVLGALSSGLLLYGASLVYGFTGEINFAAISAVAAEADNTVGLTFGLVFVIAGLAFKVSGAPFHMWTPDVYEGAPTPVTAFFSAAPKVAAMLLFGRLLFEGFGSLVADWQPIVWLIAAASMIVGSLSALVQTNIKRLLAYSSIGHVGYALIGMAAGSQAGLESVVLYMAIYLIMTLGAFACVLSMQRSEGMTEDIQDLSGLSQQRPGLALAFTALFLSLAGIPPMLGFFGKFAVFMAGVDSGLYILAVIGVLTSVVSTYYYLSILKVIWFSEPGPVLTSDVGLSVRLTVPVTAIVVTVGLLVLLAPLSTASMSAARALF